MSLIEREIDKDKPEQLAYDAREVYFTDGSKDIYKLEMPEDKIVEGIERTYFKNLREIRSVKKDDQGRDVRITYNLGYCRPKMIIERNYDADGNSSDKISFWMDGEIISEDVEGAPVNGYTDPVKIFNDQSIAAEYKDNKLQKYVIVNSKWDEIVGEREIKYYPNGRKHHDSLYQRTGHMTYKQDVYYYENGNIAGVVMSDTCLGTRGHYWEDKYNLDGSLIYRSIGDYMGVVRKKAVCMEEYDETGTKLLHSVEPGDVTHSSCLKCTDYDENGNPSTIIYKMLNFNDKVVRIIDNNENVYPSGRKKLELNADGSKTKFYETGEILSQTDTDGKETFYYKDGKQRMVIEADGTKDVTYDGGQFLLISGRHCDKNGGHGSLSELGEKQAENIGKFIAYASQGKISGLPHVILPEVSSSSGPDRVEKTDKIILETINTTLQADNKCERIESRYAIEECNHEANAELSIHSMCEGYDTADDKMGSIAFSVVGRDGFVIDRVVFTAEQIAEQLARVEEQEKLKQETKSKIEAFKEEALERAKATKESRRKAIDDSFRRR